MAETNLVEIAALPVAKGITGGIDATARAINLGYAARGAVNYTGNTARSAGSWLLDQLDTDRVDERQATQQRRQHLVRYSGAQTKNHVVIIWNPGHENTEADDLVFAEYAAAAMHDNEPIAKDRITALQALATDDEPLTKIHRLNQVAEQIQSAVDTRYGSSLKPRMMTSKYDATILHSDISTQNLAPFYHPIHIAISEFEVDVDDELYKDLPKPPAKAERDAMRPPISVGLIANPENIARLLKGFDAADVAIRFMTQDTWEPLKPDTLELDESQRTGRFTKGARSPQLTPQERTVRS